MARGASQKPADGEGERVPRGVALGMVLRVVAGVAVPVGVALRVGVSEALLVSVGGSVGDADGLAPLLIDAVDVRGAADGEAGVPAGVPAPCSSVHHHWHHHDHQWPGTHAARPPGIVAPNIPAPPSMANAEIKLQYWWVS